MGTGVGVNTIMSRYYAQNKTDRANESAGTGMALSLLSWLLFAALSAVFIKPYAMASAESQTASQYAVTYGTIGSIGIFLESTWTKIHQAGGNMLLPMIAQIAGAVTNIILDSVLILGCGPVPQLGVAGAATAINCPANLLSNPNFLAFVTDRPSLRLVCLSYLAADCLNQPHLQSG